MRTWRRRNGDPFAVTRALGCPRCNPGAAAATFAVVAAALFAWGVLSARLERADLTAPIVFNGVAF